MRINNLSIAFLISGVINLGLGVFVFIRGKRKLSNKFFTFFSFHLFIWCLISFFIASVSDVKVAEFLVRTVFAFATFIPASFYFFVITIGEEKFKRKEIRGIVGYYLLSSINAIISFSPNFIVDLHLDSLSLQSGNIKTGLIVRYGKPELSLFIFNVVIMLIWALYCLYKKKRIKTGIIALEIQYVFLAVLFATVYEITITLFPILFGFSIADRLGPFATVIISGVMVYGIAKYKIMDIAVVYGNILLYFLLSLLLTMVYFSVFITLRGILLFFDLNPGNWPILFSAVIVAMLYNPLKEKLRKFLQVNILRYDTETLSQKVYEAIFAGIEPKQILENLIEIFHEVLNVPKRMLLLMKEEEDFPFRKEVLPENVEVIFKKNLFMFRYLGRSKILIKEEEKRFEASFPEKKKIVEEFENLGYAIAIGIIQKEKLIGAVFLKEKLDKSIFTLREQLFLVNLSYQFGLVIENLKLYHQVSEINSYIRSLLDNSPFGVISFDKHGKTTLWNLQMEKIIERERMEGKNYYEFLPQEVTSMVKKKIEQINGEIETKEIILQRNGYRNAIYNVIVAPFFDAQNRLLGVQVIFSDMTKVKQLEEEVRRTEKLASLGVMAAGLAHELKNPLVSIKTFSQLLPYKYDDPEFRENFSKLIINEAERINSLVEQVLQFSRPQIGELKEVNIIDILENVSLLISQTVQKNMRIEKIYPSKREKVIGDPDKIKQVFLNILLNSVEAINHDSGKIEIKVDEEGEMVKISIKDNGCGIKQENLNKVFDPFFTTKENGTGLGLSIVARIVDEMRGKIRIYSQEGKGTEVVVYFKKWKGEK